MSAVRLWDIFCTVVDNYGDIGVTWRLARQLVDEHDQQVRLWVDDLNSFARICRALDPTRPQQVCQGVDIRLWPLDFHADPQLADIVIEAFACTLPSRQIEAMQQRQQPPLWINLEYLTAEEWIDDCHGLPSRQQGLNKFFFFPGFSERSGGLICERSLRLQRERWQAATSLRQQWLAELGLPPAAENSLFLSLFTYESTALPALIQHWQQAAQPIVCLIPQGRSLISLADLIPNAAPGLHWQQGALTIHILPMTDQPGYDQLLWSCDLNLVRGEDSFLRAQWAARPFIWHIYPQQEAAHLDKLDAFLQRYCATLSAPCRQAITALSHAYDAGDGESAVSAWKEVMSCWPEWQKHAAEWPRQALAGGDLASRLVIFCENRLK